ncbi:hypothetical protein F4801DRAFT_590148 [Xylaria longipes]|nr:hypothetical protein F4801DRAFT_590148 [Xylaria longipes]RYC57266.1 hypothetical protein CHU98_g8944 [Xylaria longipes]
MAQTFSFRLKRARTPRDALFGIFPDIPWYGRWLQEQLRLQPSSMFDCLPGFDCEHDESLTKRFLPLCSKVSKIIKDSDASSIDSIVESLLREGSISAGDEHQHLDSAATLVFGIIGWLTMLYRPDSLSCPSTEFCIADEMDGHRGDGHMSLKQGRMGSSKRLPDFLLGFGLMLPPANSHAIADAEEMKLYDKLKSVEPSTLNLHLLTTIGGVSVEWTDCLACHLELDKDARLVYLFRYPSFCRANLPNAGTEAGILHACASDGLDNDYWVTKQDVSQFLEEVLLSYRLLFGQNIRSRRLFQKLSPFQGMSLNDRDELLTQLCTSKDSNMPFGITQRDSYELARDFSHLRTKIVRLNNHLNERKPRSWTELWLDNRDSASWLTFWAVIIIGSIGLLLAFIQVILQIVQLSYQLQHPGS